MFCRIIRGELPSTIVRQWPDAIAIVPLAPVTGDRFPPGQGHVLVIPTQHADDFAQSPEITAITCARAAEYAAERGGDMNLITSKGPSATQTVGHLHVHIVPREAGDALPLPWTPQQDGTAALLTDARTKLAAVEQQAAVLPGLYSDADATRRALLDILHMFGINQYDNDNATSRLGRVAVERVEQAFAARSCGAA